MQRFFLLFTILFFILEIYLYQAVRTVTNSSLVRGLYIGISLSIYLYLFYQYFLFSQKSLSTLQLQIIVTLFIAMLLPKLLIAVYLLIDDVLRLGEFSYRSLHPTAEVFYPERRKLLSYIGIASAAALSILFLDGVINGKYRHRVRKVKLKFKNLPKEFEGYRIVQISDLHSGSFLNPEKLRPAFELINAQKPDLILFTGDAVNNLASEFEPFKALFQTLRSTDGLYSVLGNHDYGQYHQWNSKEEELENLARLIQDQKEAGLTLLRNENREIKRGASSLYLLGVENWGEKPFPQLGDLDLAAKGVPRESFKVLMSHDPTHFDHVVQSHPSNVQLTLSGHTHGMQFGLDLKNLKWSPVQYRYKKWADLYQVGSKYLYVNRGFGVIGYPGRVGINPEITLIELSSAK
ncbi:metallophosphoesterase [Chryseobacterium sp. A301]